jgi:DNA repair protein RecO (recombination protein O)
MGLVETEAIILRTYNLSEADKITVCLTRKAGLVRGVARGARRLKSRFGAGLEPFTHVNLSYFEKEGRELVTLKQAEIVRSHFEWAARSEALGVLSYFVELATEFAPPHEADERLFRVVRACLEASASGPSALQGVSVYYELWMLRIAGFLPELRRCGGCGRDLRAGFGRLYATFDGGFRCEACRREGDYPFEAEAYAHLSRMQADGPAHWAEGFGGLSKPTRQRLTEFARRLVRRALEKDLKGPSMPDPFGGALAASGLKPDSGAL